MPGNEFGERIHNFFGLEGLSQDQQHQSQVVGGSWSNGLVGNQRQIDPSLMANLKSYNTQQSGDPVGSQSSNSHHGLNLAQQSISPEYSRSLLQEHQNPTNGYMHAQAVPTEANFLGVNAESSRDKLSARGFTPDPHKSPMRFEMGGSPVNYDFFGGQQQSNSQMLQPFPRQQVSFSDMQLLKQQVMAKQMHEYQMQQQLQKQQLETRQLNYLNSDAVNGSRPSDNQSHPLINGIPLQNASSNCWQPDLMTGNTNWMHQGSSSGFMTTPEHGQANLLAQQFEPSLYGLPLGGANAPQNAFSSVQVNRLPAQHGSANKNSSLTNQPTSFLNQGDVHDSNMLPRSTYQEQLLFSHTSGPGSINRPNSESFQQDDSRERNNSVPEKSSTVERAPSEKTDIKVPEKITALQNSTTLDPTEEKFLFGSDDNLWEAFGNSTDMNLTGNLMSSNSDLFDACPSLQSGSWSALMQSAVAETSTDDVGVHEWGSKQQSVLNNNNSAPHANSSNIPSERVHSDSTQTAVQHLHSRGNKVSNHGLLEKPVAQRSQMAGNIFQKPSGSGADGNSCSIRKNEGTEDRLGIWKAASNPNLAALKEQNNHFAQNLPMQKASYGFGIAGAESVSSQQKLDSNSVENAIPQLKSRDGSQILESYASNNAGSNEMVKTRNLSMLPGGKETQSGHVGVRPSLPRKFQYHPMGNIDVTDESCREFVSHLGQSKTVGQPAMNIQMDKGHVSHNDLNCTNEAFKGMGSENSPSTSAAADNQVKSASSRLELLHKVNQSHEHSLETNISRFPAEYGVRLPLSQSSASQAFNLQLAPPSQLTPSPDNTHFSRNSLKPLSSLHTAPEKGGTSQSRFAPWASNQSFPQQSTHEGPFPGIPRESNVTSVFPYSRGHNQNQLMPVATRQSSSNQLTNSTSELSTPQMKERDEYSDFDRRGHSVQTPSLLNPTAHDNKGNSSEGSTFLSASQPPFPSSLAQQSSSSGMMSDSRATAAQHRFWNQPSRPQPDILRPHPFSNSHVEGSFSRQEKTNQLSSQNADVSLNGRDMMNMHELQGKDIGAKQISDVASMFSKMVQSNDQTFGRSLPSDNLRHDVHMAGSREGDAPKMTVKRVEDSAVDIQKTDSKGEQESPSKSDGLVRDGLNHKESANQMLHFGQTVSQSFSEKNHSASAGAEHQQISPQMAPSWYSQYGAFKNGLVQPVNDTWRFTPMKIGEHPPIVGSSADGSHSVPSTKQFNMQKMPVPTPGAETPSYESLSHGATDKLLKIDKPKKRKTTPSGLLSWNKEIMQGPQRLKTLGDAEVDWARANNRFAEKVEFETLLEDGRPLRSKRRLIYTTQLMQQLFRPPSARVISLLASSNYESVAFTAARAALGDACSSTCTDRSEPQRNSNPLPERTCTEKISDQYISKAAEDFISRSRKLETDFVGLENGTTIADLRVEVEDQEKFAVINRFARFHPPSSSSMHRNVSPLRLNSQRYVTIAPMPQNIPDMVQCLSL
ncbi:hypothetical protein Bca4012_012545 [Brassica carinata]|uniref:Uncharacterized protein n=1 Tax=Brassica carinata TaxID=52824 RepID=A0A8X7P1C8_BRACI|nr:hypothetical protein Bca52824_095890 [Brassica carinata]